MAQETSAQPEGGSGKVFLIMGLVLGIVFGGGAGYYFSQNKKETEGPETEKTEVAKPKGPLISIPFDNVAVPVYGTRNNQRVFLGNYFVDVNVQVYGEKNQIAVKRSLSQLTHGFISAISKSDLMHEENRTELDMDKAATVLKQKADEVMGKGTVENVTITEAIRMPR